MTKPSVKPERIADDIARHLLERAATLDADGATLVQLRQAAIEAGISPAAFDTAVAEWRRHPAAPPVQPARPRIAEQLLRNAAALAVGWSSVAVLAVSQALIAAPWEVHKLTDPIGLAIGAIVGSRLRARTATIVLGGLAISQGAEFLMDFLSGAPAIHGAPAHFALMIAGVAGVAIGRAVWGRRGGSDDTGQDAMARSRAPSSPDDPSASDSVGLTNAEADKRFMEWLRLRRSSYVARLQLS
jgi:hypothetical protein